MIENTYYSPTGNPEVWLEKPEGYFTPEEWFSAHPPVGPSLEEVKAAKLNRFDAVMADIDRRLIRPLANGETDIVAGINSIQARNRERRAQVGAAETVEAVEAIEPVSLTPDGMATLLADMGA